MCFTMQVETLGEQDSTPTRFQASVAMKLAEPDIEKTLQHPTIRVELRLKASRLSGSTTA